MMNELINTIELGLWNLIITLLTRSKLLRMIIRSTYMVSQDKDMVRKIAILLLICCAGFASGLLIYSFSLMVM